MSRPVPSGKIDWLRWIETDCFNQGDNEGGNAGFEISDELRKEQIQRFFDVARWKKQEVIEQRYGGQSAICPDPPWLGSPLCTV